MPAAAWKVYGTAAEKIARATMDLDSNAFRIVLLTSSYTPNQGTHGLFSDISAAQVADGGGYSTHGKLITQTVNRSSLVVTFDCDDQSWTASTITCKYAALVRDADANGALVAGDDLLAFCDLETGGSISTTSAALTITMNAAGLFTITVA
jgi:hypothetical protein